MPDTKTLAGSGRLTSASTDFGVVHYRLRVWVNDSGWRLGDGRLSANDPKIITDAHGVNQPLFLELESSERFAITITGEHSGQFVVDGQVPDGLG